MSSLLQFNGTVTRAGVHLEAIKVEPDHSKPYEWTKPSEALVRCTVCGGEHEQLHVFVRKPAGMCGCWVVFRINGEEHVPDLSVPMNLKRLPRDARKLDQSENSNAWHRG